MMSFIIVPYIKERLREYGLLLILGIRKKMLYLIIGLEFFSIWIVTIVIGIAIGLVLVLSVYIYLSYSGYPVQEIFWLEVVLKSTVKVVGLSVIIVSCSALYLLFWMKGKNLSEFAYEINRPDRSTSVRKGIWMGICGLLLTVMSFTVQFWYGIIARMVLLPT